MDVVIPPDADAVALLTAQHIASRLRANPDLVLGLATGRTMERVYAELARMHREEGLCFADCRTFNLDEYVGLGPDHPSSYRHYMNDHLFRLVDVEPSRTHVPDGLAADTEAEGQRYEACIRAAGGIGLQLLGIGDNGHIGFNEPMSPIASRTRSVVLTNRTRRQNEQMFGGDIERVPVRAITMGIGTILEAGEVVLAATGVAKAAALANAMNNCISLKVPASALQLHPKCCVIADMDAASKLRELADPALRR